MITDTFSDGKIFFVSLTNDEINLFILNAEKRITIAHIRGDVFG